VSFRLDGYLTRVGWTGPLHPTLMTLTALLRAHIARIPFENLDVLLGRGIRVDLDSVYAKLVTAGRGGYCYEHATLFRAALEHVGFQPVSHSARVVMVAPRSASPRTHMFLTVSVLGEAFVIDPGFGGHGPLVPVPLVEGREIREGPDVHRMTRRDGEWVLETQIGDTMTPLWMSTLEAESAIDFEMANHFTSTWTNSPFVNRLMLRALTPDGRVSVMNRDVTISSGGPVGKIERTQLADRSALKTLLAGHFGIDLPEVERLRVPSVPEWD
jgi:N-hydroxyarylamine O-acetyltransferase